MRKFRLLCMLMILSCMMCVKAQGTAASENISTEGVQYTFHEKQAEPKFMKGKYWNMLATDGNIILAYEMSYGKLSFVRFDRNFTVSQEVEHKALPKTMASLRVNEETIDGIFYDKKSVVHVAFDKQTLEIRKQEVLLTQEKIRKFADKYTDVYVSYSDNGKYIAMLAMWDHASVALAFSSNHMYLYDENFTQLGYWSLDEDKRCVGLGSRENAGLWEHYHPNFQVYDDGTIAYAALHDQGSNLYSSSYGKGSSLNVHILTKDGGQKDYDFGRDADAQKLMYPCIVSFNSNELVLAANYARYPKDGVRYNVDGYKILKCNLVNSNLNVQSFGNGGGMYNCNKSVDKAMPYSKYFPGIGYILMFSRGYKAIREDYKFINIDGMGSSYHDNRGAITLATESESNGALFRTFIDTKLFWLDVRTKWDSYKKKPYKTTLRFATCDFSSGNSLNVSELYQNEDKEATSIDCCRYDGLDKYLILIDKSQWAEIQLR